MHVGKPTVELMSMYTVPLHVPLLFTGHVPSLGKVMYGATWTRKWKCTTIFLDIQRLRAFLLFVCLNVPPPLKNFSYNSRQRVRHIVSTCTYLGWSLQPHQSFWSHPIPTSQKNPQWRDIAPISRANVGKTLYMYSILNNFTVMYMHIPDRVHPNFETTASCCWCSSWRLHRVGPLPLHLLPLLHNSPSLSPCCSHHPQDRSED